MMVITHLLVGIHIQECPKLKLGGWPIYVPTIGMPRAGHLPWNFTIGKNRMCFKVSPENTYENGNVLYVRNTLCVLVFTATNAQDYLATNRAVEHA